MSLWRRRRGSIVATAAGVGLLLLVALQLNRIEPTTRSSAAESPSGALPTSIDVNAEQPADEIEFPPANPVAANVEVDIDALLARSSLRGTQADGEVVLEPDGRLRVDPELRRRLDYYLTLIGELSLEEIRALLHADIARAQGNAVADLVATLFDRYVGMRQALAAATLPNDPLERFERTQALRRQWLGDDADRLFADELDYDAYTAERLAVREARDLPASERAELLDQLAASRPMTEQMERSATLSAQAAANQTERFDAQQIAASARHAERSAQWGEEAADRLAALDAQREQWQQRMETYAAARRQLMANSGLSPAARNQALANLLSGFSAEEQARLLSLAEVDALPDGG